MAVFNVKILASKKAVWLVTLGKPLATVAGEHIVVSTRILSSTTFFSDQHIKMISEGSCDTKDWSNDAENPALPSQE